MSKILMLDLEGVLIATGLPEKDGDCGVRPNAQYFVDESFKLFDQIFLNTCVRKKRALEIMQDIFNTDKASYYPWDRSSPFGKASGYEQFLGSKLIHVEDGFKENKEAKRMIQLGYTYISVSTWTVRDAFEYKNKPDVALISTLDTIKESLII